MARYELTDFEWKTIRPLLPNKPRGVPRVDDRRVLNGIFRILRSGRIVRSPSKAQPACFDAMSCSPGSAHVDGL
jgi:transposase